LAGIKYHQDTGVLTVYLDEVAEDYVKISGT
jgi:hypothetical protein